METKFKKFKNIFIDYKKSIDWSYLGTFYFVFALIILIDHGTFMRFFCLTVVFLFISVLAYSNKLAERDENKKKKESESDSIDKK